MNRVKQLRQAAGISQRAFALKVGTSTSRISLIERGESSPTVETAQRIARALGATLNDVFPDLDQAEHVADALGVPLQKIFPCDPAPTSRWATRR